MGKSPTLPGACKAKVRLLERKEAKPVLPFTRAWIKRFFLGSRPFISALPFRGNKLDFNTRNNFNGKPAWGKVSKHPGNKSKRGLSVGEMFVF